MSGRDFKCKCNHMDKCFIQFTMYNILQLYNVCAPFKTTCSLGLGSFCNICLKYFNYYGEWVCTAVMDFFSTSESSFSQFRVLSSSYTWKRPFLLVET